MRLNVLRSAPKSDPDDPGVRAALDLVRWELSMLRSKGYA
jgi:hypothetical protein